jgi:hypothetical protein
MGILAMPMMCTTQADILGMVITMFSGADGADGNATKQMMMDMMKQQMMMLSSGGLEGMDSNMPEAELQQGMNMVVCFPMMDKEMTEGMMDGIS